MSSYKLKLDHKLTCNLKGCEEPFFREKYNVPELGRINVCKEHYDKIETSQKCQTKVCNNLRDQRKQGSSESIYWWHPFCKKCTHEINELDLVIKKLYNNMHRIRIQIDNLLKKKTNVFCEYEEFHCHECNYQSDYNYDSPF